MNGRLWIKESVESHLSFDYVIATESIEPITVTTSCSIINTVDRTSQYAQQIAKSLAFPLQQFIMNGQGSEFSMDMVVIVVVAVT